MASPAVTQPVAQEKKVEPHHELSKPFEVPPTQQAATVDLTNSPELIETVPQEQHTNERHDSSAFTLPPEVKEDDLNQLVEMGFDREEARVALIRSNNNIQNAANLLLSDVTSNETEPETNTLPTVPVQTVGQSRTGPDLINLSRNELFTTLNSNPQMLNSLVQSISEEDQELAESIRRSPDRMYDVLHPSTQQPTGLTSEDEAAITRLCGLGFSRMECEQAYIVSDKNETIAANLLLDGFN